MFRLSYDVVGGKGERFLSGFCLFFMFLRGRASGLDCLWRGCENRHISYVQWSIISFSKRPHLYILELMFLLILYPSLKSNAIKSTYCELKIRTLFHIYRCLFLLVLLWHLKVYQLFFQYIVLKSRELGCIRVYITWYWWTPFYHYFYK